MAPRARPPKNTPHPPDDDTTRTTPNTPAPPAPPETPAGMPIGIDEAATILGLTRKTIYVYRNRYGPDSDRPFPRPITYYGQSPVFDRAEIEAWGAATPPAHRPRKNTRPE